VKREKSNIRVRHLMRYLVLSLILCGLALPARGQNYYADPSQQEQYYREQFYNRMGYEQAPQAPQPPPAVPRGLRARDRASRNMPTANLQYDQRDAEAILRDQLGRGNPYGRPQPEAQPQYPPYQANYYDHRISEEGQVQNVMEEARYIGSLLRNLGGKPAIVMDKRTFQFYLFDRDGRLLRIGPVAIGKGKTEVGAFETPVGVFPIKAKVAVDDWVRPDWYFIEEGEPIPKKWEDRRVPGFFRYKLVFDGSRYIHYAEATGGRLTHGCLGLDWQDAEAVFHTLEVGSYCIVMDHPFLNRLAKGEFPIKKPAPVVKPDKPEGSQATVTARAEGERGTVVAESPKPVAQERAFRDLW
jgi:hypothetical protein